MESDTTSIQKLAPHHAVFSCAHIKWRFSQSAQGTGYIDEAAMVVKLVSSCGLEFSIGNLQQFGSKKEYPPAFPEKDYKKTNQR
jgi:hypothetical protein